ncbi:unnamed protein product [Cladocopium goreaui]|uniref:Uncharacterized protein n=3 Tax=Cladocopium goreaui TaxID=2562237 RepID=A0A9P1FYM3_9DINO|nr:unnamed protein product [Cladocopium goreaui]
MLTKVNKLNELSGKLDEAMKQDESSPHRDRVNKSQKTIEGAVAILEEQFEAVQLTKAEVNDLQTGKLKQPEIER